MSLYGALWQHSRSVNAVYDVTLWTTSILILTTLPVDKYCEDTGKDDRLKPSNFPKHTRSLRTTRQVSGTNPGVWERPASPPLPGAVWSQLACCYKCVCSGCTQPLTAPSSHGPDPQHTCQDTHRSNERGEKWAIQNMSLVTSRKKNTAFRHAKSKLAKTAPLLSTSFIQSYTRFLGEVLLKISAAKIKVNEKKNRRHDRQVPSWGVVGVSAGRPVSQLPQLIRGLYSNSS